MILRSIYTEISCRRVAIGIHTLERVDERIRCCGFAAVSALELGLLRAIQCRLVQQRRATDHCDRFDANIPPNSELMVSSPEMCAIRAIGGYIGGDNLGTTTSARLASTGTESWAKQHMANSIDKTPKPPCGET